MTDLDAIRARVRQCRAPLGVEEWSVFRDRADLLALLDKARGLVAELEAEVTNWRAEGVQRHGMLAVAPDDPVQRARSLLARFPTPSPTDEETT